MRVSDVKGRVSSGTMHSYGNSLYGALKQIYPEHDWKPFLFMQSPVGYWNNKDNIRGNDNNNV